MYEQTQLVFKATRQKYYVVVNFSRNNAGITTRILVKKIPNISRHDKVVLCKLQQSKMLLPLDINFLDLLRTIVSLDLFIIDGDQKVVKFHSSLDLSYISQSSRYIVFVHYLLVQANCSPPRTMTWHINISTISMLQKTC